MLRNATSGLVSDRRFDIIDRRVASSEAGGVAVMASDVGMTRSLTGSKPLGVNGKRPLNLRKLVSFRFFQTFVWPYTNDGNLSNSAYGCTEEYCYRTFEMPSLWGVTTAKISWSVQRAQI